MKRREAAVALAAFILISIVTFIPVSGIAGEAPDPQEYPVGLTLSDPEPGREFDPAALATGARAAASSIDLTDGAPPIGNQGSQASCVGFALGYYGKTWWEKREHPGWDLTSRRYQFSPAFIYNQINGGQDRGASLGDGLSLLQTAGACDWEEFGYDGNYTKQPDATDREAAKQYRISPSWGHFFLRSDWAPSAGYTRLNDISGLKAWLASGKPAVLGIPIYNDFPSYGDNPPSSYYTSADYYSAAQFQGGHGVFIAGYDDNANPSGSTPETRGGFKVLNSWGSAWNGGGTVWLSYRFVQKWVPEAWYFEDMSSAPDIAWLTPYSGAPGEEVTFSGSNFGAYRRSAKVGFAGGATGTVVSWSNGQVRARVPAGADSGSACIYDWDSGRSNGRLFTVGDVPPASWLFAEGATWPGFEEWLLVQNPNDSPSTVSVSFITGADVLAGPRFTVSAKSRVTIRVNDYAPGRDVASAVYVESGPPVGAERAMYVDTPGDKWGSHASTGARAPAEKWYLAEGATWSGYEEWVTVLNPNDVTVKAELHFDTPAGRVQGPTLEMGPMSRGTVRVNDHVPPGDVSTEVSTLTAGRGVVAERSMYVRSADGKLGCHNSMGVTDAAAGWALPEGATWPGYEHWVVVQNPTGTPAEARFLFLTPDGQREGPVRTVGPGRRISVRVNDHVPGSDVSTLVLTGGEGQAVVAERAMYVRTADGKLGTHNSTGSMYSSSGWFLPEGATWPGFEEWVLVMNPAAGNAVWVELTFMTENGVVPGPRAQVPARSRRTFRVNDYVIGNVSTMVMSDSYVVCERSMYISTADGKRGAHCSLGLLGAYVPPGAGGAAASPAPAPESGVRLLQHR